MSLAHRAVGNLPVESTTFVGRRRELGEIRQMLTRSRLVTLTGVGGTGKTRLGIRVAAEVRRAFPDGVWLVDLTSLRAEGLLMLNMQDPDVVAYMIMIALGLQEQPGGAPPAEQLVRHLADRQALLVLDNCEHLMPVCAILADSLLLGCRHLRILATSREPLFIDGETIYAVPPLPAPGPGERPSVSALGRIDSVALFVSRAQAAAAGFALTRDNAGAVTELCRRLDGLPLAIELAAAQTRTLSPVEILNRLAERFALLNQESGPQRQLTLGACIDWSFNLCSKPERLLWARLAVFSGGFELDAVEGVCAAETLPGEDILEVVQGLIDKSILIRADDGAGTARYRMLETIRSYGQDRLEGWGEQLAMQQRHSDWYTDLMRRYQADWLTARQPAWFARLDRELPNLRVALQHVLADAEDADEALAATSALAVYWTARGLHAEARAWLDQALTNPAGSTLRRLDAVYYTGVIAGFQGDVETTSARARQLHDLAGELDSVHAHVLDALAAGQVAMAAGDLGEAVSRWERAVDLVAGEQAEEFVFWRLSALSALASAKAALGDADGAAACHESILAICEPRGEVLLAGFSLWALGLGLWRSGDVTAAAARLRQSLQHLQRVESIFTITWCLDALAWIAADEGRLERAATLIGAVNHLAHTMGVPPSVWPGLAATHEMYEQRTRTALGARAYQSAVAGGAALSLDEAMAYALEEHVQPLPSALHVPKQLTPSERRVAHLIGDGLSNQDIARSLVISQRTAESHVEHILAKLGLANRAQVAAWVTARGSDQDQDG